MAEPVEQPASPPPPWSQVWHLPTVLLGLICLALGVWLALPDGQANDFPAVLESAEIHLDRNEFDRARVELSKITENITGATAAEQARHWMLRADLIFLEQRQLEADLETNHLNILEYYEKAEDLGATIDPDRLDRYGLTLLALGRYEQALAVVDRHQGQPSNRRYGLIRKIVDRRRALGRIAPAELAEMLTRFDQELRGATDAQARRAGLIWSALVRAEAQLEDDDPRQSIQTLALRIQRLASEGPQDDLARLYLLLARSHQQTGEFEDARRYYLKTQQLVTDIDLINADVLIGLGQLDLTGSDRVEDALEKFRRVVTEFPNASGHAQALVGLADCEAKLGLHSDAADHLRAAVSLLAKVVGPDDLRRQELVRTVMSHYALNFDRRDFEQSLHCLSLLVPLYADQPPATYLVKLAVTHEQIAESKLGAATGEDPDGLTFQEAAIHFREAGKHYHDHANAVTIVNDVAHGKSLWQAAVCYDKAQLWQHSIDVYAQFVKTRASDDRYLWAIHKLGLAFLADGQYKAAADRFVHLIEQEVQSQVAIESIVPLARCQVALGEFDQAKHGLQSVLNNHPAITPDSEQYGTALIEMGKLHYQREEFEPAIAKFTAAVKRYVSADGEATAPEAVTLLFLLADANRRSVDELDEQLAKVLPRTTAERIRQERLDRLHKAQTLYSEVIERMEKQRWADLPPMHALYHRNSYFYRGDCAFQVKNWNEAIALYDSAAKRFEDHPASLVALVQIVNAYAEQGKFEEARTVNKRARFHLNRIPDEAFEDDSLPMSAQHWKHWLRWSSQLDPSATQAKAPSVGP